MTTMEWHLDSDTIDAYRAGDVSPAMAASLEAHVVACAACRDLVSERVDDTRRDRNWSAIADRVDAPRRNLAERILLRLGMRDHIARLLMLTPTFRLAWFAAVAAVSGLAVVSAADGALLRGDRGSFAFLVLAPLLPVVGVATAFTPRTDAAFELAASAPFSAFELLLVRAAAVLVTSTVVSAAASIALPGSSLEAVTWLLPALGLTTATLALARWVPINVAAGVLSALWLGAATISARGEAAARLMADYPAFRPAGQAAFLALTLVATASALLTRRSFDLRRSA
jgi:hypothetical protein